MRIGNNDRSLEITGQAMGDQITLRIWDWSNFCEIDLDRNQINLLVSCLNGVRCPDCGEVIDNRIGGFLPVIDTGHVCKGSAWKLTEHQNESSPAIIE